MNTTDKEKKEEQYRQMIMKEITNDDMDTSSVIDMLDEMEQIGIDPFSIM